MPATDTKHSIKTALESFQSGNLSCNAINLFKAFGYNTERQAPLEKQNYDSFKSSFVEGNSRFNEEKAMVAEWKYVDILFQISHEEITKQYSAFKKEVVTKENGSKIAIESFLFFAIELKSETYSRSALSHITREVNKLFPMPAIVLFKHGLSLTLAVINRRLHKRDESKDVLEKVTFIKDINIERPHRAHIEILFDLSFEKLLGVYKFTNFVELHSSWQKTLDTKELNNKFYKELSNWYFWAMEEVYFPGAGLHADENSLFKKEDKEKEHNATNLIRLLTRLLFVWFIKEKGLIPEEFFDEKYVADELLINFKPKKNRDGSLPTVSCYYRAILQNLFFATLNQNMGKREFRRPGQHMNVTNLLRYERYFKDPSKYIKLVEKTTPFMNGGLFECLDIPDSEKRGKQDGDVIIYQDGFSDRDVNQLKVPDYIFFGAEDHVDLSAAYGDNVKEYKNAAVKGLINILKSYKFTVAENTPLEEEIALDPELLGRVFENLLASYNPETKTTARKQTGSFYTPREIVNYMVDESLIAYLKQKLEDAGVKDEEEGLRDLVSYSENKNPFNKKETDLLISAIDSSKILDPACGSGAFPMGILHKLVNILHKLDPKNELWEQKQIGKARTQDDSVIRDQLIADIEAAFENNELDYGRKLYLIENCIYGVDIQPIATQISKLRFFISLIVDQKVDVSKDNLGVRPLPNFETKFVAANTLVGIEKPKAQITFGSSDVKALEEKLRDVRHRLFSAKTPPTKRKLRVEDKLIREQMGNVLVKSGWKNETARQLANWDPYDQNASSPFFDPEWMFGVTDGFDVVIGNPPYIDSETMVNIGLEDLRNYLTNKLSFTKGNWDIYIAFFEVGFNLLVKKGIITYITPDKWISKPFGNELRRGLLNHYYAIAESGRDIFESVNVDSIITFIQNKNIADINIFKFCEEEVIKISTISKRNLKEPYAFDWFFSNHINILNKLERLTKKVSDYGECENACATSDAYKLKDYLIDIPKDEYDSTKYFKVINTGTIDKFVSKWGCAYMTYLKDKYLAPVVNKAEFNRAFSNSYGQKSSKPKIIIKGLTLLDACIDEEGLIIPGKTTLIISDTKKDSALLKFLLALLNSKLPLFYIKEKYRGSSYNEGINFNTGMINNLPVPAIELKVFNYLGSITDYIIKLKTSSKDNPLFYSLIDCMVYELYFPDEIKAADAEVLKHLPNLLELKDDWSDERKLAVIEKVYKELSDPKHSVSVAMSKMRQIEEVRIIEGKA